MDRPKASVTRESLERILARAAELQAASGDESEQTDRLTEEQILDLGREVGLSPENIRQALAEEHAHIEPLVMGGSGLAYRLFGAQRVGAQRVVRGAPDRLLETIDRWMQREAWMNVVRQRSDRIVWEPRRGMLAGLRRVLGGKEDALGR